MSKPKTRANKYRFILYNNDATKLIKKNVKSNILNDDITCFTEPKLISNAIISKQEHKNRIEIINKKPTYKRSMESRMTKLLPGMEYDY
ncbi:hypothetical protein GCM10019997_15550 [Prevotella corporis]